MIDTGYHAAASMAQNTYGTRAHSVGTRLTPYHGQGGFVAGSAALRTTAGGVSAFKTGDLGAGQNKVLSYSGQTRSSTFNWGDDAPAASPFASNIQG